MCVFGVSTEDRSGVGGSSDGQDEEGRTAVDLAAANEKVKTVFAEYYEEVDTSPTRTKRIMFLCLHLGLVTPLTAVLQSGANLKCTDKERRTALELAKDDATFQALKTGGAGSKTVVSISQNDPVEDILAFGGLCSISMFFVLFQSEHQ